MNKKPLNSITSWPTTTKYPGLSGGWEGAAWVSLQNVEPSHSLWNSNVARGIYRKLLKKAPLPKTKGHCGIMIGLSSRPLVAALASKKNPAFKKLLPSLIQQWTSTLKRPDAEGDLMFGKAGALLAATEIETVLPGTISKSFAKYLCKEVVKITRNQLDLLSKGRNIYVGISHGLAGYLLSLESAQYTFGFGLTSSLREELITTIANQRFIGPKNSAYWPTWTNGSPGGIHGWCHGSPGISLVFLAGYQMTGRKRYKDLAIEALEGSAFFQSGHYSFCCGLTGKAQALIEGYRVLGDKKWLKLAAQVAKHAAKATPKNKQNMRGFHRGRIGRYYLEQRLKDPKLPLLGLGPMSVGK